MANFVTTRIAQLLVLLQKNFILAYRGWKMTLVQLLAPVVTVVLLLLIQLLPHTGYLGSLEPKLEPIEYIPPCEALNDNTCYSLMYAPNNISTVNEVMERVANKSNLKISTEPPGKAPKESIVAMPDMDSILDWLWNHQNTTQGIVYFNQTSYENTFAYTLMYNGSCDLGLVPLGTVCPVIRYQMQHAVDEAIIGVIGGTTSSAANITLFHQAYPWVSFNAALNDTVKTYGVLFFYCGMMFNILIVIYQIVYEKENKLKMGMKLMGLTSSVFWMSWFITQVIITTLLVLGLIITGYACVYSFFLDTNFFVLFVVFELFGLSMLMMAFFITTICKNVKQAVAAAMLLFIVGILIQMLLSSPDFIAFIYYDYTAAIVIKYIFIWYPPFNFAKAVSDINARSFDLGDYEGPGYSWGDLYQEFYNESAGVTPPATIQSLYLMMLNFVIFAILTWYMENLLPGDTGAWQSPWFFLTMDYWGIRRPDAEQDYSSIPLERTGEPRDKIDADVQREDDEVVERNEGAVVVKRMSKIYKAWPLVSTKGDVHAVDNVSISIEEGSLFCLLGHNGAGKTTTINMLTGLFPPSSGYASIFGKSVLYEMEQIRQSMGMCPQHDILWPDLTAREHLELFSRLKGIPKAERKQEIKEKLESVTLHNVADDRVKSFSGGMKRRLSVAISGIGDPRIIFMDEPTTGMDPLSKRHVWDLIQKMKAGRVIVLTTHSMEEADTLATRIGIMAHGKLMVIGNSLHLKKRFGQGYRVSIAAVNDDAIPAIKEKAISFVPGSSVVAESGLSLVVGVPDSDPKAIVPLFSWLEEQVSECSGKGTSLVVDWGVSQTTLEDVFLRVTRGVYSGGRRLDGVGEGADELSSSSH